MIVRPATRADFEAFYGELPSQTVKAWVAVEDDKPVGIGGYYLAGGMAVAFTDQRDMSKRDMVRGARALMAELKKLGMEVVAGSDFPNATILKHFGFEPFGDYWRLSCQA